MKGQKFKIKHAADLDKMTVAGKPLEGLYNGYFGDHNMVAFMTKVVKEPIVAKYIQKLKEMDRLVHVLEVGSGTGIVGKAFARNLNELGLNIKLILSDRNIEALKDVALDDIDGVEINKVVLDNKVLTLFYNAAEFVVGRSFSHYEKDDSDELIVFEQIYKTLKSGGVFINQAAGFPTETEARLWRDIQQMVGKVSNLQTPEHTRELLNQVFGKNNVVIAKNRPPAIHQTSEDFRERFKLDAQSTIIDQVRQLIQKLPEEDRLSFTLTDNGFSWDVVFTIFISCK